jgi:hypothetical protein
MPNTFNPNQLTFEEGLARIKRALDKDGVVLGDRIVTSRDPDMTKLRKSLAVTNVPNGFVKYQLPVSLDRASQMFITIAQPDAEAPSHAHEAGAGIRFIAGGSIIYNGQELTAGDWMYVPARKPYSFKVGPQGALMCYCYCCCCASRD